MRNLFVKNNYKSKVWLAISYYSPGCSEFGTSLPDWEWASMGWWLIEPGQSACVLNTNNPYAYCYAESDDGLLVWVGDYSTRVFDVEFNRCFREGVSGPTQYDVGMFEVYLESDFHTLNLNE